MERDRAERDEALNAVVRDLGGEGDFDLLVPHLYDELKLLARSQLRRSGAQTLNTTGLVHEAYIRLARNSPQWASRRHVFAAAAKIMRHLLVDAARRRMADKRGGGAEAEPLDEGHAAPDHETELVIGVHRALEELATLEARWVQIVECRYFAGLSDAETAEVLDLSDRTVRRDWVKARAWLQRKLGAEVAADPPVGP